MADTSSKYQRVTVTRRVDFAPDLWAIRVQLEDPFSFKPGQYATLGVEGEAKPVERAYSIVSSPLETDELEFFFELVQQGELTPRLYELQVGQSMLMRRQSKGLFTLDGKSGHKLHYLVCTVTGVAPYISMARTFVRQSEEGHPPDANLVVLQAASRSWEFAYREELECYAKKYDWLTYIPTVSRPWEDPEWKGEVGRAEDVLRKYCDLYDLKPSDTTAYLCGHPQMIENCKGILSRFGYAKESLKEEIYWIPKKATA